MKLKKKTKKLKTTKTKKARKYYFGKEAHAAIVKYQESKCLEEKNKIYTKEIRPSFDKLTENLIFIHGFASDKETFAILKADCVSFLFEILQKFDPSKGSKAFSYFNVCAKNFLIIQNKKKTKRRIRNISIDDQNMGHLDKIEIENSQVIPSQESLLIIEEDKKIIFDMIQDIKQKTNNANEKKCIDAINTIFKNIQELDFLNKRAIFVYLRELSGLNAKQLSVAMSNIRRHYKDVKRNNYLYSIFSNDVLDG
tara:strand:+ start:2058 stop:2816 length:759 start_codon:yes stop_codon:yes gene_type:complete